MELSVTVVPPGDVPCPIVWLLYIPRVVPGVTRTVSVTVADSATSNELPEASNWVTVVPL